MTEMKTLTINGNKFEVVDGNVRNELFVYDTTVTKVNTSYRVGYYKNDGTFVEEASRLSTKIDVEECQKYRISTKTSSKVISGVLFFDASGKVVGTLLDGTGNLIEHKNYEFVIPSNVVSMVVQSSSAATSADLPVSIVSRFVADRKYVNSVENAIIKVKENLVDDSKFYFDEGNWSGNNTDGFTHTKGSSGSLTYGANFTDGKIYLVEFDSSYKDGEFGVIGIGETPKSMMYNGTNHIAMFLYATANESGTNCVLRLTPYESFEGTLSNFAIYEVDDNGSIDKDLLLDTVVSKGHEDNYGFYNVLIGYKNMPNNPTSTRTICIGNAALAALKAGHRNVSIGTFSLSKMEEGDENVVIGADCAFMVKKGKGNIALGKGALYKGDELNNNVSIGHLSMKGINPTGVVENNTAVGTQSNYYNNGSGNTTIGYRAGFTNKNGNNNTNIGYKADTTDGCSNTIVIGANAKATKSNQMVLGDKTITDVVVCGDKHIVFKEEFDTTVGDIDKALDAILAIQEELIGGDSV